MILFQANNLNYLFYARDNDGLKNQCACIVFFYAVVFMLTEIFLFYFYFFILVELALLNSHTDSLRVIQFWNCAQKPFTNNCVFIHVLFS